MNQKIAMIEPNIISVLIKLPPPPSPGGDAINNNNNEFNISSFLSL
jgi:hypothetical protein